MKPENMAEKQEAALEDRLTKLENGMKFLEARAAIADLMGRYAFYYTAGQGERIVEELWTERDAASLEYGASGVYRNLWKVKTFYFKEKIPGRLSTLALSTPHLEVDTDGESARGLWTAFCTETDAGDLGSCPPEKSDSRRRLLSGRTSTGEEYRAEILLQRYDVDFIRENGVWKILHLHVYELFRCPYDRDWVVYAKERFATDGIWLEALFETPMPLPEASHGENLPSGPSTRHWQYTTQALAAENEILCGALAQP